MELSNEFIQAANNNFQLGVDYPGQGLVLSKKIVDEGMIKVQFKGRAKEIYFEYCVTNEFFLEV